ncbi:hypothetical protein ACOBV9_05345 [Pseudoalteromonas espejiana]
MSTKKTVTSIIGLALFFVPNICFAQCSAKINKVEHVFDNFDQYHSLQTTDAKNSCELAL